MSGLTSYYQFSRCSKYGDVKYTIKRTKEPEDAYRPNETRKELTPRQISDNQFMDRIELLGRDRKFSYIISLLFAMLFMSLSLVTGHFLVEMLSKITLPQYSDWIWALIVTFEVLNICLTIGCFGYVSSIDDNYSNDLRDIEDEYRYSIGGQEQWLEFEKKSIKQIKLTRRIRANSLIKLYNALEDGTMGEETKLELVESLLKGMGK